MSDTKSTTRPAEDAQEEQDVEGNSMLIGTSISADLARGHRRDLEQAARERARAKEARHNSKGR
jgi:hypothetical protein